MTYTPSIWSEQRLKQKQPNTTVHPDQGKRTQKLMKCPSSKKPCHICQPSRINQEFFSQDDLLPGNQNPIPNLTQNHLILNHYQNSTNISSIQSVSSEDTTNTSSSPGSKSHRKKKHNKKKSSVTQHIETCI